MNPNDMGWGGKAPVLSYTAHRSLPEAIWSYFFQSIQSPKISDDEMNAIW